jgi:hypothetical protein
MTGAAHQIQEAPNAMKAAKSVDRIRKEERLQLTSGTEASETVELDEQYMESLSFYFSSNVL